MSIIASEARKQLFPLIEKVNNDRIAVEITSRRGNAVLISAEEFAALEETAYSLRVPANAKRLLESLQQAKSGDRHEHDLVEWGLSLRPTAGTTTSTGSKPTGRSSNGSID